MLLMLPREIRDNIYSFIQDERDIRRSLWVCRQLYDETHQLFYNRFTLDLDVFEEKSRLNLTGRLKCMPKVSGPLLKNVHIFIPSLIHDFINREEVRVRGLRWCCLRCQEADLEMHKLGLSPELAASLRLAINPEVLVSVFYSLCGTADAFRHGESAFKEIHRQMFSLFTENIGFPGCKRLVICCDVGWPGDVWEISQDDFQHWKWLCSTLEGVMERGSSLQHLEVCFTHSVMDNYPEFVKPSVDPLLRDPEWLKPLARIRGLKSVKVMVWEKPFGTWQHPSMRANHVEIDGFNELLKSETGTSK
ncbi:MAG: hypothetical protein Q9202_000502 [Teloschistes flavicans]